jgi:hypothetical protein
MRSPVHSNLGGLSEADFAAREAEGDFDSDSDEDLRVAPEETKAPVWNLAQLSLVNRETRKAKTWVFRKRGEGYFCRVCQSATRAAGAHETWTTKPCTNKNMNKAIQRHFNTKIHLENARAARSLKSIPQHVIATNQLEVLALTKRFRSLYYLIKGTRALSDYPGLVEVETINGAYDDCKG